MRWLDDPIAGGGNSFEPFQALPIAAADVAYARWPAAAENSQDSLDGAAHILALASPTVVSGSPTGAVFVYKFTVRARNPVTGDKPNPRIPQCSDLKCQSTL